MFLYKCVWSLLVGILALIFVNGVQRCYYNYSHVEHDEIKWEVDLYAENLASIPKNASAGMYVLIDQGAQSLETGIYQIRDHQPPRKIGMPESGKRYHIKHGTFAGFSHKIKSSFLEVKPSYQTQTFSSLSERMTLEQETTDIYVQLDVTNPCILDISSMDQEIRFLNIHNPTNLPLLFVTIDDVQFTLDGFYIGTVLFTKKQNIWNCYKQDISLTPL